MEFVQINSSRKIYLLPPRILRRRKAVFPHAAFCRARDVPSLVVLRIRMAEWSRQTGLFAMLALQDIFSQMSDAVFATDGAHRIVYQNSAFTRIFPHRNSVPSRRKCHEVLCGRTLDGRTFCHPDCPVGRNLLNGQAVENFDLAIPREAGEPIRMSVGAVPVSGVFDNVAAIFMLRPIGSSATLISPTDDAQKKDDVAPDIGYRLTRRERQILILLAKGLDTRTLANTLHISYVTARNHIQHIYEKLHVHNRAEAVSYVYRRVPPR